MKTTPGPWRIVWDGNDGSAFKIVDAKGKTITGWAQQLRSRDEHRANAYSIGALPDLLEALTDAQIAIGEMDESWLGYEPMDGYPYKSELMDKIKAAIAKATKEAG